LGTADGSWPLLLLLRMTIVERLMLIASAGYDPRAAVRVWTKFGQIEESRSKYLSTHPPHNDRSTETSKWMPLALEKYNAGRQSQAM